jgi:hypothetical protein
METNLSKMAFPFFSLPLEIRMEIYFYVLTPTEPENNRYGWRYTVEAHATKCSYHCSDPCTKRSKLGSSLLLVNKQMKHEASEVVYRRIAYRLNDDAVHANLWLAEIGSENIAKLRDVEVTIPLQDCWDVGTYKDTAGYQAILGRLRREAKNLSTVYVNVFPWDYDKLCETTNIEKGFPDQPRGSDELLEEELILLCGQKDGWESLTCVVLRGAFDEEATAESLIEQMEEAGKERIGIDGSPSFKFMYERGLQLFTPQEIEEADGVPSSF